MPRRASVRRTWFWALGVGPIVLLAAFMPSLLYLGHWTGSAEHEHDSSEVQEAAAEHAAHCHYGPASCSQQQQIAVNARVLPNVVELEQPSLQSIELTNATLALEEYIAATPTDPPQL